MSVSGKQNTSNPENGPEHIELAGLQTLEDGETSEVVYDRLQITDKRFFMVIIGFGMAFVGSQFQPLIFITIYPLAAADLNATDLLVWFFTTNLLSTGIISPFVGTCADLFGRKRITILGVLSSLVGMILSAASPNVSGFLAGQVFAGIGVAVQELMAIAAIAEIVPTKHRGYYIALVVASFLPFTPGSFYGALISQSDWRYCACFVAIWNVATMAIISAFYHPKPRPNSENLTWNEKVKRIDLFGGLLMSSGIVLFLVGLNWGGQAYPWNSARVICFLTIGLFITSISLLYDSLLAPFPMFPRSLLKHPRTFIVLMLVVLLAGINYVSVLTFWVLEVVGVYDSNRIEVGIRTLPFGFCIFGGALISAIVVSAFKKHLRLIMTFFCIVQATGIGCMAAIDPHNIATVWGPLVFSLIGVGGVLIPNQLIMTIICPPDLIATATCLTVGLRAVGQVIGTSIFYTQLYSVLTDNTYKYVVPVALRGGLTDIALLESMMSTLLGTPWKEWVQTIAQLDSTTVTVLHEAVLKAFIGAFNRVWLISTGFGGAAVILSVFIEDLSSLIDGSIAVEYF